MIYFRTFIVLLYMLLISLLFIPLAILFPYQQWWLDIYRRKFMPMTLFILGIKIEIINKENLTKTNPCLFLANHQHNFDLFIFGSLTPKRSVSLGKKTIAYIPFFGIIYWLGGNILIDRSNKKKAWDSIQKVGRVMRENKINVTIFPEGTRNPHEGLKPFKRGPFVVASQAKLPIVPVVLSSYKKLNFNKFRAGTIKFKVLEPIDISQMSEQEILDLSPKLHDLMSQELKKI